MKRSQDATHRYWENLVKRTWEALRRNKEFYADCQQVGAPRLSDEEAAKRFKRFTEKWGVKCNDPDLSYDKIKTQVKSWQSQRDGQREEDVKATRPDIPVCFVFLLSRLQGYSGPRDTVVSCKEIEEMCAALDANAPRWGQMTPDQWREYRGDWAPPDTIHFTISLDADPLTVRDRVFDDLMILRYMRYGASSAVSRRVFQVAQGIDGYDRDPQEGKRHDFAQDDQVWQVWDLKQQNKTDMEIAQIVWPAECQRGKGRDTKTGDKGPLAQRVHDYHQRAKEWIMECPKRVRHSMKVL